MGTTILFTLLQLQLVEPYHMVQWKLPTYTRWYGHCHLVSGGPDYVWLAKPYHVVPLESSAAPKHGIVTQNSLYFSASTCEHLWPSPSNLVNCTKCSHNHCKDAADWSVVTDFKSLLNFKNSFLKIWFSQTSPFVDM